MGIDGALFKTVWLISLLVWGQVDQMEEQRLRSYQDLKVYISAEKKKHWRK